MTVTVGGADVRARVPLRVRRVASAPARRHWLDWVEPLFAGIAIDVFESGGMPPSRFLTGATPLAGSFDSSTTMMQAAVMAITLALTLLHRRSMVAAYRMRGPYWLLLALVLLSATWSQAPENTLRRSVSLLNCLMFVHYAHVRFGLRRLLTIVIWTTVAMAVSSIALGVASPNLGRDFGEYKDAIRGIFNQKNDVGEAMLIGVTAVAYRIAARRRIWPELALFAVFVVTTALSRSTTALLLCGLAFACGCAVRLVRRGGALGFVTIVLAATAAVAGLFLVSVLDTATLFGAIGKDPTLTSRTPLWAEVWDQILERPLTGYGYAGFWLADLPRVQEIWWRLGWEPPHAHNGFLDTALQLGIGGVLAMTWMTLRGIRQAVGRMRRGDVEAGAWFLIFTLVYFIQNMSETLFLRPDGYSVLWIAGMMTLQAGAHGAGGPVAPAIRSSTVAPTVRTRQPAVRAAVRTDSK